MPKNKENIIFIILIFIFLSISISDLSLTYIGTPDLTREQNPLVSSFGFDWSFLIFFNVLFFAIFVACTHYTFVRYKRPIYQCEGIRQFISMYSFNRPDKFIWWWYKFPTTKEGWGNLLALLGYMLTMCSVFIRTLAVIDWIGILSDKPIAILRNILTPHKNLVILCIFTAICFCALWFVKEYINNKRALSKQQDILLIR